MYKPVRPRPKRTSITRSRNGCKSCRERRTKCDEQKPSCGTCSRLGIQCENVRTEFKFHVVTKPSSPCSNTAASSRAAVNEAGGRRPDRASQGGLYLPNIDLGVIESLQHTERDVFYSTYWEDTCLPAVHPVFNSITGSAIKHQMLKDAILALSSCNMSRHTPHRRRSLSTEMGAFSPGLVHQTRSQLYYSSAIRSFASLTHGELISNAAVAFTVLVLFAYIESSMGNLMAFNCHAQGLESISLELSRRIGQEATLRALLAAWMQIRFVVWWARAYFSILDVHRGLPSIPLPALLQGCLGSIHERRVVILSIMCESHRLNSSQLLSYWSRQADIKATDGNRGEGNDGKSLQRTCEKLVEEARKLDNWISNLPLSEQPLMFDSIDFPGHACTLGDLHTPIYFQSHEAALNFAYYAVARIMQCTCTLHQLQYPNSNQSELVSNEEEPWVRLLLRIAKGTDIRMSISRNNYTIGFSGLLLAAALRCQSLSLGLDIEAWLGTLQSLHPTEEGAFPVYQTLAVVKAINQRRTIGRDVFGVTLPVDDGGGSPKFTCYNSQSISTLLLHGRCSFSGALLTEPVGIIDSSFS